MNQQIAPGKWVELAYDIYAVESHGNDAHINQTRVFQFTDRQPDRFVFGQDPAMLPKFCDNINGLHVGDTFDFTLPCTDAFGERDPEAVIPVPRSVFVRDGEFDSEHVVEGAALPMQFESGHVLEGRVLRIDDEHVTLDFNHQLAGYGVRYRGTVLTVRDATAEELAPKHSHCGCGHCDHDHDHDCGCDHCDGCSE